MTQVHDTIVLGLGATGSATLYQLAKLGNDVLGIDRHAPPHDQGSSHGDTRITRLAIGEGAVYTPIVLRSHQIWREIEAQAKASLLTITGGLIVSSKGPHAVSHVPDFFARTVEVARKHGIAHELLDAPALRRRFPPFRVRDDETGYYEPGAGFLRPEACVGAQLKLAERHGAKILRRETVLDFTQAGDEVVVTTDRSRYRARRLVVCAGPWLPGLLGPRYASRFRITRQALFWFDASAAFERFAPEFFPVFIWELPGKSQPIYGFPAIDGPAGGIKIASEQTSAATTPDAVDRNVSLAEVRSMYEELVAPYFPEVGARCVKSVTCLYTATHDANFVVDTHPQMPSVIVASPCSGHGFKHSAALGEAIAQRIVEGVSRLDLAPFATLGPG